jgi:hypothetical protein
MKGEYLFKKGDKPDYAYVICFGSVILLNVQIDVYQKG